MNTIKSKLFYIFLIIFIVITANGIIAVINFFTLQNSIDNILKSNYESVLYAQNMAIAIERQDSAELTLLFEGNKENPKKVFQNNREEFLLWLSKEEGNITEPGEDRIVTDLKNFYDSYLANFDNFQVLVDTGNETGARDYYYKEIFPIFENIKQKTRSLVEINENKMITLRDESKIIARNATSITLATSGFTILISIFFVLYLTNKIIRPVRDLIQKTRNIANRNYDQQINIVGKDEIAALATEFNIMALKLKQYDQLNIKQLMKEKQKVEAIVESISDGVIVTGAENRILLINKAAEKIFNIKESEVIKKDFLEVIKNDDLLNYINDIKIKRIFSIDNYLDIKIKRKGVLEYFRAIAKAITNIEGEGVGVVTLLQNITKLKEVDKLKSEFISSISHELRTPITSVIMATEILDKEIPGQLKAEQKKMTKIILEDGNRLKELINDILDLSRLESGKITFNLKPNNLRDIADSAIKLFEIQKKETDIEIINTIDKKLPGVLADFSKISEVFTNLIANSINYKNKDRKLKITISAKEADDVLVISFSDNGRGISEEDQKKIFDRFVRVDETEAYESIAGTGLGLAISKDIINKHDGKIWVESRLSRGTTFYITLNKIKDKEKFNDRKE